MNSFLRAAAVCLRFSGLLVLTLILPGCNTPSSTSSNRTSPGEEPLPTESPGSTDLLRPGDIVIVNFSGVAEPPPRIEDRIREDGCITLPLVGSVKTAGHTRAQLQIIIHDLYVEKYYKRLTVSVNPDVRYFYVRGEVKRPLNYPYVGGLTVLKAIAAAGDFTDFAKKTKVELTRAAGAKPIIINCIKAQKDSKLDLAIFPDDRIFVPRRLF